MPGARADEDRLADEDRRRLEDEVAAVLAPVGALAEQQAARLHDGGLILAPGFGAEGVELDEPAALEADEDLAVVEEAAGVDVAAVAARLRDGQAPELLSRLEAEGAVGRHVGVVEVERVAATGTGEDDVALVLAGRLRVLDHGRAALDDVVEARLPDHVAGRGVDLVQAVVVAAEDDRGAAALADDDRLPRPAHARPLHRRVLGELARGPAAADARVPEEVEAARCAEAGEVAPRAAEQARHLDAVAVLRDGRRRRAAGEDRRRRRGGCAAVLAVALPAAGRHEGAGVAAAGPSAASEPVATAAAARAAGEAEQEDEEEKGDERGGAAPAELAPPGRAVRPRSRRRLPRALVHRAASLPSLPAGRRPDVLRRGAAASRDPGASRLR